MRRSVKGVLFADYVRMLRHHKAAHWSRRLSLEDLAYLQKPIQPHEWYPMETFERLGDAILDEIARGDLEAVRMWGRFSADHLIAAFNDLIVVGNPVETLSRFGLLRDSFFDFEALQIVSLGVGEAQIALRYEMGHTAEEAACCQTVGFFERLLERAGAETIHARFLERAWKGDLRTLLDLSWRLTARKPLA